MSNHLTIPFDGCAVRVDAVPLDREAFAPFGDVIENPRPGLHPSAAASGQESGELPFQGLVANQGSALKYQHVSRMVNLYDQAPSGRPGIAVMNMFVCASRRLLRSSELDPAPEPRSAGAGKPHSVQGSDHEDLFFPVTVLERHPYTTQTFTPLTADPRKRFLVIVAPSLPPSPADQSLPCPKVKPSSWAETRPLPGRGLPDLSRLRAFLATSEQAVTYGAGTWHAPMVALGQTGTALDFLVIQFANGEAIEDCQEVYMSSSTSQQQSGLENLAAQGNHITHLPDANPYEALIKRGNGRPAGIQAIYSTHRVNRNAQQREKFLAPDYKGLAIDPFLLRLENPEVEPGFQDTRNCLVFWARPPEHIIQLASQLQRLLKQAAPGLWLMPSHRMHLTTMEVTHSRTPEEISELVSTIRPAIPLITNHTYTHRCRLVKPMLSYDLSAVAVSFLPAAGEKASSPTRPAPHQLGEKITAVNGDEYTYHHLRRDVFEMIQKTGVEVDSRYVLPSAHITLGRYLTERDHDTPEKRESWVRAIAEINQWLETEVWDADRGTYSGEWMVGQERGLEARSGTLWYGGGRTLMAGEGF
ncbi:Ureidoglycolate hydrolase domain containing protein [Naviculisporaceae sp. PSN 640]